MNHSKNHFRTILTIFIALTIASAAGAGEPGELYPALKPFKEGFLRVSPIHSLWYGLFGNPDGTPVFVLHGGPGAGCYPRLTQYFDPEKFLIVLHDQRGAGLSKPSGELRENTTADLVEDLQRLREHLKIDGKMYVFGGSWGSCLALAYAEKHPENVAGMIIRGVFTGSRAEIENVCAGPAVRWFFPDAVSRLQAALPEGAKIDPPTLHGLINGDDAPVSQKTAKAWARYGMKVGKLHTTDEEWNTDFANWDILPMCKIDLHYMINRCFLEEGQLLRDADKLADIPITIINGRYDMLCPPATAAALHELLPKSKLIIVEEAGHSETEERTTKTLVEAAQAWKKK